jgi:hypothetical protein
MNILRRVAPAFTLFFLSPLVAEFVLGDLNLAQLGALFALAPFYGGGAILIREVLRRSGRSWPSFLFLGLAYALVEEGIADQSLFNPDFLHLRLLDYGWVPALGTSPAWSVYVLGIHIAWSLAVPIGLTESFFAPRGAEPWLGRIGLAIVALLYLAGFAMVLSYSLGQTPFRASPLQIGVSALLAIACIAAAFLLFPRPAAGRSEARRPGLAPFALTGFGLVAGSAFLLVYALGRGTFAWPWSATFAGSVVVAVAICLFFGWANRGRAWTERQSWGAAFGGLLCYAWYGYSVDHSLHGPADAAQHSLFVAVALAFALWAGWRAFRRVPPVDAGRRSADDGFAIGKAEA